MISVVILTFNEAINIGDCIDSVLPWTDDIHVIDSGSTDDTVAIAKSKGAQVYTRPFVSFADQHNWAHTGTNLKHNWVLHLDADERMTEAFAQSMFKAMNRAKPTILGFYCCWKVMSGDTWLKYSDCYPRWQLRLVHKSTQPFVNFGHAQKEGEFPDYSLSYIPDGYLHLPFNKGWSYWLEKHNRYSTNEAKEHIGLPFTWKDFWHPHPSTRTFNTKSMVREWRIWPILRFLHAYIYRLGFVEGGEGLSYCLGMAFYEWMVGMKIREIKAAMRHKKVSLERKYQWDQALK